MTERNRGFENLCHTFGISLTFQDLTIFHHRSITLIGQWLSSRQVNQSNLLVVLYGAFWQSHSNWLAITSRRKLGLGRLD